MAGATRLGDKSTGHDDCAPSALVTASGNVFINGKGAGRVTDQYAPHGCPAHPSHQDSISAGSATVFINGLQAARIGDAATLAGTVAQGSGNVFIGG